MTTRIVFKIKLIKAMKSALVSMNVQKVNIEIIPVKKRYKTRLSPETYSNPVINIIIKNQITQLNPNS